MSAREPGLPHGAAERDAQMLERVRQVRAEIEERRRARPDEVLDAARLELLDDLTGAPDAKAGYRLLRSLVDSGATTWQQVWNDAPGHGVAAVELKLDVVQRLLHGPELRQAVANLGTVDRALRADPDGVWREVAEERRRRLARGDDVPDVPGLDVPPPAPDPRPRRRPGPSGEGYGAGSR